MGGGGSSLSNLYSDAVRIILKRGRPRGSCEVSASTSRPLKTLPCMDKKLNTCCYVLFRSNNWFNKHIFIFYYLFVHLFIILAFANTKTTMASNVMVDNKFDSPLPTVPFQVVYEWNAGIYGLRASYPVAESRFEWEGFVLE